MSKAALLVLDMQNELIDPKGKVGAEGFAKVVEERKLIERTRKALDAVRAHGLPVVFVRVGFRADYADAISQSARLKRLKKMNAIVIGTWGLEFPDAIKPLETEMVYTKRAVSPFFNTGLLTWLRHNAVTTVALCGVYTHMVVDSAARFADDSGFVVKVLEDCCASPDPELHRVECEKILPLFGEVMSSGEFIASLQADGV
ncbi:MAG: cysteine hydrolase [Gammaproteobacteria bacterium]|nr:cysteine hydrolase [Gammaproteobacteria bacterium]